MYEALFTEFGIILAVATGMAFFMRLIRQPLIIGHIITGVVVGPLVLDIIQAGEVFRLFGEIGIAFLLFTVGLNLNPKVLKDYGKTALITGLGQVTLTTIAGFLVSRLLGFGIVPSLYISVALAFSSTIIILKLISDRGDLDKLYAKISIGFLLVQDLVVFVLLFLLPLISTGGSPVSIAGVLLKAVILLMVVFVVAKLIVSPMHLYLSRSQELLFLFAISWGIGISVLFLENGFPFETGALIAGVSLAILPTRQEISARLMPLRDFFIIIFFILLGSQIVLPGLQFSLTAAVVFSLLVLIGNPIILMAIMGFLGYRSKTSLQTGMTVAQISEFSLIFVALGVSLGHIGSDILSMVTLVGLVTIFGSTYLILYSDFWHRVLKPYLRIFERRKIIERKETTLTYNIILFGGNRVGFDFIESFKVNGHKLLVVDHDPEVIARLSESGIEARFGDAGDPDFLDSLDLDKAELIVSSIPDVIVNTLIINKSTRGESRVPVMALAHSITNALALYREGAAYVILPHFLGASYASGLARRFIEGSERFDDMRGAHIMHLKHRAKLGHEHPVVEKYR